MYGRDGLPAQHRPRRDPRPGARARRRAHRRAETRSTGPQWAFAPCICVARDDRWGRTYESFGEDPQLVREDGDRDRRLPGHRPATSRTATACSRPPSTTPATATTYGTGHQTATTRSTRASTGQPRDFGPAALAPYVPAVQQHHVGSVMPSYSTSTGPRTGSATAMNMHGNRELITGVLKGKMGFDGFVISDYDGIDHIDPGHDDVRRSRSQPASTPASTCSWSRRTSSTSRPR